MSYCPECKREDGTHPRTCAMFSSLAFDNRMKRLIATLAEDYQEGDTVSSSDIAEAKRIAADFK